MIFQILHSLSLGSAGLEATLSLSTGLDNEESSWRVPRGNQQDTRIHILSLL